VSLPFRPWTERNVYELLNAKHDKRHTKETAKKFNEKFDHCRHIIIFVSIRPFDGHQLGLFNIFIKKFS